ncbi:ogr/Delta-like zinc finger family protein [uncultured Croceicoccus sp.]|uniref:ogr/Delta-like zinc finger family protein n=1 Tax=uncultured Croceicoccus sp. TaxID=1295329 RepID=UPI00261A5623|nr:ogr/Delta-like zinc finger family protein [uncultured Croceicoccus sp.]
MSVSIACPHCSSRATVRTSRAVTPLYRQLNIACRNAECGHTFAADMTITHTISPSAIPDPEIHLRTSTFARRAVNDNPAGREVPVAAPANDDDRNPDAVPVGF